MTHSVTLTYTITPTFTITLTHTVSPTFTVSPTPITELVIFPNPYNREDAFGGTLKIELPFEADVFIYNIAGYKVFEEKGVTGRREWDGKNKNGEKTAPGIYYYIVRMSGKEYKGRIFITK